MTDFKRKILVTGGAGFIGSHVVRRLVQQYPHYLIINFDKLTYAGNLENLNDVASAHNYVFVRGDICDSGKVAQTMAKYDVDSIIHLAAESHVDRSIEAPLEFARTNVMGTLTLLQCARTLWEERPSGYTGTLFYHISTDEVYGTLPAQGGQFTEHTPYDPHSPYSASKAASDHFVRSFHDTYGMPVIITNCSNNYGPYQFPEKLIPLCVNNILHGKPIPVYGTGTNVRDWLYVEDHASAIDTVFHHGTPGDTYNIGGCNEWKNIDIVQLIIKIADRMLGNPPGHSERLVTMVADRKGHDLRYAIDSAKLQAELGWKPSYRFEQGIEKTIRWYLANHGWLASVTSGDYKKYYERMYSNRG